MIPVSPLLRVIPMPLTLRSYTPDDLATLAALKNGRQPSPDEIAALARELGQPNLRPERDCVLAFDNGAPAGYAYLTHEPAIARGVLDIMGSGAHKGGGVGDALLAETEARAHNAGLAVLHVDVPESDEPRWRAFANRGWRRVRTHLHLSRSSTERVKAPLPDGMTLRMAERDDAPAVTNVQNAAFSGSWGYALNTPKEIEYRIFDLSSLRPDPVLLLEERGGLVAYCWCRLEAHDGAGLVGMVGVLPDRQGQGLGRAVTAAGVNALLDLGGPPLIITVDSENPPAIRVYESVGFTLAWRSFWFELRL